MKSKQTRFTTAFKTPFATSGTIVCVLCLGVMEVQATDRTWQNGGTTDWNTGTNWSPSGAPTSGDNAIIISNTGSIATISAAAVANDVLVGNGGGTNGRVDHTSGTLTTSQWFKVGHNGGTGIYNLTGTGTGGTYTGKSQGSGSIVVGSNGQQLRLGGDGSGGGSGTLNVHTTGIITVFSDIAVGKNGSGTLNMDSGTITKTGGTFIVGEGSGITGLMQMSGGTVTNTGEFWVGNNSGGSGTLTLSGGSINQDSWFSIGRNGSTGVVNLSGGTITKTATNSHFVVGDGSFANSTGTLTQSGGAIDLRSQLWIGKGLSANNTSSTTGTATISAGTVQVDSWLAVGRDGATGPLTISGTGSVTQGSPGDPFSNVEMTNGTTGSATVNLGSGATGGTLTAMGIVKSGGSGSTSTFNFNGGTLRAGRNNDFFLQGLTAAKVKDGGAVIDSNFNITIGQALIVDGTGGLTKNGSGTLTLSGSNTYNGATTISSGTLKLGGDNVIPDGAGKSDVIVNGTLDVNGLTDTINGLSGSGAVLLTTGNNSTLYVGNNDSISNFSGSVTGISINYLRKIGNGTLTLSGAGDNSGLRVKVDAGTLVLGKDSNSGVHSVGATGNADYALEISGSTAKAKLGGTNGDQIFQNSAVNITTGGTFDLAGLSEGFDGLSGSASTITNSTPATTSTLTLGQNNSNGSPTFAGVIEDGTGTVALTKTTATGTTGTQTLTATNTYTGATTISAGTLQLGDGGATGSLSPSSPIAISTDGTLDIKRNNTVTQGTDFSSAITGSGGLTQDGSGTIFLTLNNSYSGTTAVNSGTLGGNGSVAGPLSVLNSGILQPGVNNIGTFSAGSTTFTSGGVYICDVRGATSDKLIVTGNLDGGSGFLEFNEITPPSGVLIIAQYTGTVTPFASEDFVPAGYQVDYNYLGQKKVAIKPISASAFGTWATANITSINPGADATPTGDPDNDGQTNLAEFGLNGNPLSGAASGKVVSRIAKVGGVSSLVLTIPVRGTSAINPTFSGLNEKVSALTDGIVYRAQGSPALSSWNAVVTEVTGADKTAIETGLPGLDGGWFYRTFTTGPVSGSSKNFMRAVIEQP